MLAPSAAACGVLALVLAACAGLAWMVGDADYHATAIGWTPLVACVSAVLGALLYLQLVRRSLRVEELTRAARCTRGQEACFVTRFRNAGPLPLFGVEAHFAILDERGEALTRANVTLSLGPRESHDLDFRACFEHLGTYRVGLEYVVVSDYLRLFRARLEGEAGAVAAVEPRTVELGHLELAKLSEREVARPQRSVLADSMDYAGVRDYRLGDPLKTIHWKISARSEEYVTRLFELSVNPGIAVLMCFAAPPAEPAGQRALFDGVVEAAFSVLGSALGSGLEAQLCYCSRQHEQVRRAQAQVPEFHELADELPRLACSGELRAETLEALRLLVAAREAPGNIVVCAAELSGELVTALVDAKARGRQPVLLAAVPAGLEGRERERWLAPLAKLEESDISYLAFSRVEELAGVVL